MIQIYQHNQIQIIEFKILFYFLFNSKFLLKIYKKFRLIIQLINQRLKMILKIFKIQLVNFK